MQKTDLRQNLSLKSPKIHESAFIAKGAQIIGDVEIKADASVWYNSVLRGDINRIVIGERSNIQDGSIIHLENDLACIVGNDVTVGHNAILHGCTVEDGALIGMGAIVLNGAVIKKGAVVGAGAIVKEHTIVEENSLVVGVPARLAKTMDESSYEKNVQWAAKYVKLAQVHKTQIN